MIENDRSQRSGLFQTGPTSVAPPLATTDFSCRDEGNCNPRFMRSSLYNVPTSQDLLKQIGLPFVLSVQPFAELHPDDQPLVLTDMGPQVSKLLTPESLPLVNIGPGDIGGGLRVSLYLLVLLTASHARRSCARLSPSPSSVVCSRGF